MGNPVVQVIFKGTVVQSVPFDRESLLIGRSRDNDLVIDNLSVSRHHARLSLRDGQVVLEDQGSENGCLVNGRRVGRATITDEDEVFIGKHQILLRAPESESSLDEEALAPHLTARSATPWDDAHTYCLLDDGTKPVAAEVQVEPAAEPLAEPVRPASAPARPSMRSELYAGLILQRAGRLERVVAVEGPSFVLGRAPECDLMLDGPGASRRHARIVREGERFFLEDLGSANGTLLNGARVERCALEVGDELRIDEFQLTFVLEGRPLAEEIRVAAVRAEAGAPAPERTIVLENPAPPAAGTPAEPADLFGRMEELTPTPPEPAARVGGALRLELEIDPTTLPPALRAALEHAVSGELEVPVRLRWTRRG
jgi:pSer/pThr/pTyr-binding forkhead associated (FHA) protein